MVCVGVLHNVLGGEVLVTVGGELTKIPCILLPLFKDVDLGNFM